MTVIGNSVEKSTDGPVGSPGVSTTGLVACPRPDEPAGASS